MLWDGCTDEESELLESVQYEAGKVVTGAMRGTSRIRLMTELGAITNIMFLRELDRGENDVKGSLV